MEPDAVFLTAGPRRHSRVSWTRRRVTRRRRTAERVRLDAGGRRPTDGGEAGGLEGAAGHAEKRGGCLEGGRISFKSYYFNYF